MHLTCRFSIDKDFGVGHYPIKEYFDAFSGCCLRGFKLIPISARFIAGSCTFYGVPATIGIFAESLQLPVARYFNLFPFTTVLSAGTEKLPRFCVVYTGSRQVDALGVRSLCLHGHTGSQGSCP